MDEMSNMHRVSPRRGKIWLTFLQESLQPFLCVGLHEIEALISNRQVEYRRCLAQPVVEATLCPLHGPRRLARNSVGKVHGRVHELAQRLAHRDQANALSF